jgi:hypothetical protein
LFPDTVVFERLLFPLSKRVYRHVRETLDTVEKKHPDGLRQILSDFEVSARTGPVTGARPPSGSFTGTTPFYIGITRRTWQERYRQHRRNMGWGSNLLFHRALRGEFCSIGCIEHIVEYAGLTEHQAFGIEEKEVEKRSLHSLFPNGLNMIPGGYARLEFVRHFAARTGYTLRGELTADGVESVLADVQRHSLHRHFNTSDSKKVNAEIARL